MVDEVLISEQELNLSQRRPTQRCTDAADAVFSGATRLLTEMGWACLWEAPLANNRRADILALSPKGEIAIVEVKSGWADFQSDEKWPDYLDYCDRFYFAVDDQFPRDELPADTGLIIADQFGGAILRPAYVVKLAGARRKALTLAFARLAAQRLWRNDVGDRPEGEG